MTVIVDWSIIDDPSAGSLMFAFVDSFGVSANGLDLDTALSRGKDSLLAGADSIGIARETA